MSYFCVWCFSVWRGCLIFAFGALAGRGWCLIFAFGALAGGRVSYFCVWCFRKAGGCLIFAFGALACGDGVLFLRLVL